MKERRRGKSIQFFLLFSFSPSSSCHSKDKKKKLEAGMEVGTELVSVCLCIPTSSLNGF